MAERAARKWAKAEAKKIYLQKRDLIDVPNRLLHEIIECLELLEPYGKRIPDLVREYVARPELQVIPWTFREAANAFLESRRAARKRTEYLRQLDDTFNLAAKAFGPRLLDEISTEQIELWLSRKGKYGPLSVATFGNYRRALAMLWGFAGERHRCSKNPVAAVVTPSKRDEPVKILTARELEKLLNAASATAQTYIAVMAFAGVRPFEVLNLSNISVDERSFIRIEGRHAKSRTRRLITISQNLSAWLRKGQGHLGQVRNYWSLNRMIRSASGIASVALSQDVFRHSFASHHLALHRDAALTAHEMGHRSQQVLFEHYRELVTPEEGKAYFGLFPPP